MYRPLIRDGKSISCWGILGSLSGMVLVVMVISLAAHVAAADLTTTSVVSTGSDWNGAIWKTNGIGVAVGTPSAGNTYQCNFNGVAFGNNTANTRIRNPLVTGPVTFGGDSLMLNSNAEIRLKIGPAGASFINFPGVGGGPGLILNGGFINIGDNGAFTNNGIIRVDSQSYICGGNNGGGGMTGTRSVNLAGQLNGSGDLVVFQCTTNYSQNISGTSNTFSGQWRVKAGWLLGSGNNSLGTNNLIIDPACALNLDPSVVANNGPAVLEAGYDLHSSGALTLTNGGQMCLHQNCVFNQVNIEGVALSSGLHNYTELAGNFPASFLPGGSGSISVAAGPGNVPPTLDPITDLNIQKNAGMQTVNLTGITSGTTNPATTVTISAGSGNPAIIPNPTVHYTSPNSTGTLTLSPASNAYGTVWITVTVDNGASSNHATNQAFKVTVTSTGTNYFVNAATGNDSNLGTSVSAPWKTITNAAARLQPGDTVYIMAGNYRGDILPARSGQDGAWITYSNYPGQTWQAVITNASFRILRRSYINVSGLKIQNSPTWGFYTEGPGGNYIFSGNYTTNTFGSGIAIWGVPWGSDPGVYGWRAITNVLVTDNLIEQACNGDYNEQLDIANGVDAFELRRNVIRNAASYIYGGEGIDCKEGASNGRIWGNEIYGLKRTAIYLEAGAADTNYYQAGGLLTNIEVFANRVHDNGKTNSVTGLALTSEGRGNIDGIKIYNNLFYQNSSAGINIYHYKQGSTNSPVNYARNIFVLNNTVFSNNYMTGNLGGIWIADTNAVNVVAANNISVSNINKQINIVVGVITNNNLTSVNPRFINAAVGDFHLQSTSPAIDAGDSNSATLFDYDGNPRPWGLQADVGAFEYSPANPVISIQPGASSNTPGITIQGTVGGHYQLQWSSQLNNGGAWNVLQDIPVLPASPFTVNDTAGTTQRFYRAMLGSPY